MEKGTEMEILKRKPFPAFPHYDGYDMINVHKHIQGCNLRKANNCLDNRDHLIGKEYEVHFQPPERAFRKTSVISLISVRMSVTLPFPISSRLQMVFILSDPSNDLPASLFVTSISTVYR